MDFDKSYPKQSEDKAVNGVWQPMSEDFEVLVAKSGNPRFIELSKKVLRPHRVAAQRGQLSEEMLAKLASKVMAKTILLDWRGTATFGGQPVGKYSPERAEELLIAYAGFREDITKMADEEKLYADDAIEAELGNSSSTSSGSSGGENSSL